MRYLVLPLLVFSSEVFAEERRVFLETLDRQKLEIGTIAIDTEGSYTLSMNDDAFADHFLSMRPFKCIEGTDKHWCHVPYPYEIKRSLSEDYIDLEYDFLFVWKSATDYGIKMWNGVYYRIVEVDGDLVGTLHEMDMDLLSAPPAVGVLRPLRTQDIHESDPESHWLPRLVISSSTK